MFLSSIYNAIRLWLTLAVRRIITVLTSLLGRDAGKMSDFGFCGATYQSQSSNVDAERCVNLYPEIIPGQGRPGVALYPTPGLDEWPLTQTVGPAPTGPNYSLFPFPIYVGGVSSQRLFGSFGNAFFEFGSNGSYINRGSSGAGCSRYAVGTTHILLCPSSSTNAASLTAVYEIATGIITPTQIPNGAPETITAVAYINGFYVAMSAFTDKIYFTTNPTTWDAADVFQISTTADLNLNIISDHGQLWVFSQLTTQPFDLTGDPDIPFQPIGSGFIQQGIGAGDSLVQLDNTLFWIGGDVRGKAIGWRANGYIPQRVTNHDVEYAWSQYSSISDAIAYPYQDQGHSFWHIYFPTADKTWVFDVSTNMWHERAYLDPTTGIEKAHRTRTHAFFFDKHLVGDRELPKIYEMKIPEADGSGGWNFVTDNGDSIRRVRRAPYISKEQEWIFHNQLQIDLETGLGPIPPLPSAITNYAAPSVSDLNLPGGVAAGTYDIILNEVDASGGNLGLSGDTQITISASRILQITIPNANSNTWRLFVSLDGGTTWVYVDEPGPIVGDFSLTAAILATGVAGTPPNPSIVYRNPQLMLSWSDDWGHSFNSPQLLDVGGAGEFNKRVIARRLGRSRGRVYEVSCTDPIPWRFVGAYVKVSQ